MVKKRGELLNTEQAGPKRVQRYGLFWKTTAFSVAAFREGGARNYKPGN
jgi:hypothetical protein